MGQNGELIPDDTWEQVVARLDEYLCARRTLLGAIGRPRSNRDPLAEWAEWLAARVLGGTVCDNPVQPGYDVELPNGTRVQVKYLANALGRGCWPNQRSIRFPKNAEAHGVNLYALLVVLDLRPVHLLTFHRPGLERLYDLLDKTHRDRGERLSFTKCNYERILSQQEEFAGLVDVSWENPELA